MGPFFWKKRGCGVCARPAKARMFSGRKRPTGEEVRAP
ncbi:hypothetical protein V512_004380 [Mesotoga sp. Brook.08.105.5.1]|nr:hypothetical protein V512_004380 [Mesotoga sp. Brook.08.105.5.1]